jgi:hypothetical protein
LVISVKVTTIPINLSQDLNSQRLELMAAALGVELWFTEYFVEKEKANKPRTSTAVKRRAGRGRNVTRGAMFNSRRGRKRHAAGESSSTSAKQRRREVPRRKAAAEAMSKIGNNPPGESTFLLQL